MAEYTQIKIGSGNIAVTQDGAFILSRALKLPNGISTFKDMDMTDCIRTNGNDIEYYTAGSWFKIMSSFDGVYLTEEEIDLKISQAVAWGQKEF
jgi:hypothetical protein